MRFLILALLSALLLAATAAAQTSETSPARDDAQGDGGADDVGNVWVSADTGTTFDLSLRVHGAAGGTTPSVAPAAYVEYAVEFRHVRPGVVYTVRAYEDAGFGWVFTLTTDSQPDGNGISYICELQTSLPGSNVASGVVTWTLAYSHLSLTGPVAGADCTTVPTGGTALAGDVLDSWVGAANHQAGIVNFGPTAGDETDGSTNLPYTLGGTAPPPPPPPGGGNLTVEAFGPYWGTEDLPIVLSGVVGDGTPPYACTWSASSSAVVFLTPQADCSTATIQLEGPFHGTVRLTATDSAGTPLTAFDVAPLVVNATQSPPPEPFVPPGSPAYGRSSSGSSSGADAAAGDDGSTCAARPGEDLDRDGIRDLCDADMDGDHLHNAVDNCPMKANGGQNDVDGNGVGDACEPDEDGDLWPDAGDNCPSVANPGQQDLDDDRIGDACDADLDGDGEPNATDAFRTDPRESADLDQDGIGDGSDPDADGDSFGNTVEAISGTDPMDAASVPVSLEAVSYEGARSDAEARSAPAQAGLVAVGGMGAASWIVLTVLLVALGGMVILLLRPREA